MRGYDGYTSCLLITESGKVLLAEFKYGPELNETFGQFLGADEINPGLAFYHLKKNFFHGSIQSTWPRVLAQAQKASFGNEVVARVDTRQP